MTTATDEQTYIPADEVPPPYHRMAIECDGCGKKMTYGAPIVLHQRATGHEGITELGWEPITNKYAHKVKAKPKTHERPRPEPARELTPDTRLDPRAVEALEYINRHGPMSVRRLARHFNVSMVTALGWLIPLAELGLTNCDATDDSPDALVIFS